MIPTNIIGPLYCYYKLQRVNKFIDCLLPLSLPVGSLSPFTKLHDIEVSWKPSKPDLHLDSSRGKWVLNSKEGITIESKDENSLRSLCSSIVFLDKTDSKQLQMSTILLLEIASSHNIPTYRVTLGWSFSKIDEDGNIILSSGLSLPIITSIERMNIQTEKGREMNKHDVNEILNYVQHSQRLKALFLYDCVLPSSIPVGPSLSTLKSRGVKVLWTPDRHKIYRYYLLDLGSGLWLGRLRMKTEKRQWKFHPASQYYMVTHVLMLLVNFLLCPAEQEADVQQRKQRARGESPSMTNKSPVSVRRADLQQRRKRARGESRSMTNKSPVCRKYIKWSESASKCVVENFECYTKGLAEKKLPSRNEIEDFLEEGAIDHMFDW
ncbi:uncharacterized protein [Apostichopus japonicus]|uniref:uncharacterized protein isoform X2 n=1 Tax=Stichopus japonicus TaxID=307972 RepID=UPI003AB5E185